MVTEQRTNQAAPPPKRSARNMALLYAGGGVLVLLCLCVAVMGVFLYLDPFDWELLARLMGGYDPVAETMPADTAAYMGIDLLRLRNDDAIAIFDAFAEASGGDVETTEDAAEQMDEMFEQANSDISYTEDIQPWVGQYAGIALLSVEAGEYGYPESAEALFTVESRDVEATDEFIEKLIEYLEEDSGMEFDDKEVSGGVIYEAESDFGETLALGRIGNYFYMGSNAEVIEDALASPEESLADDPAYQAAVSQLPGNRAITLYLNEESFETLTQILGAQYAYSDRGAVNADELFPLEGMAVSLSVADERINLDAVTVYKEDGLTDDQIAMLSNPSHDVGFASYFPDSTFFLGLGSHIDLAWGTARDSMIDVMGEEQWDQAMQDIEQAYGFNPEDDLIANLDGAWALGYYSTTDGFFAEVAQLPMGFLFLAETSDAGALANVAQDTADALSDQMGQYGSVDKASNNGMEYFEVRMEDYGPVWAFGTSDSLALVSTNADELTEALNRDTSLANNEEFIATWSAFPQDMAPALYVNAAEVMDLLNASSTYDDPDTYNVLSPLRTIGLARAPLSRDMILHSRLVIVVETGGD